MLGAGDALASKSEVDFYLLYILVLPHGVPQRINPVILPRGRTSALCDCCAISNFSGGGG